MEEEKRLDELALRSKYTNRPAFTRFLDPSEARKAETSAKRVGVILSLDGGWPKAERRIGAFFETTWDGDFPIAKIGLQWNEKYADVSHRDLLGAVLSLGIERSTVGDIIPGCDAGTAYLFCMEEIAGYIISSLARAGNAALHVARTDAVFPAPPSGRQFRETVSQLRLDSIVASGWGLSRSSAQKKIREGLVKLDHLQEDRVNVTVNEGAVVSVRGLGRIQLEKVLGPTKKGRIAVLLFRFDGL